MVKQIDLLVRRPELSPTEFLAALLEENAPAARALPQVRGYVVNRLIPHTQAATVGLLFLPAFDVITELWFDSLEALRAARRDPAFRAWWEARQTLLSRQCSLAAEEHPVVIPAGARPPLKNINFNSRKLGLTLEEYRAEWLGRHSDLAHTVPHLEGFANDEVLCELPQAGVERLETAYIQGIAIAQFQSDEQQNAMIASPEAKAWFAHGRQTFGCCHAYSAWESVIVPPNRGRLCGGAETG